MVAFLGHLSLTTETLLLNWLGSFVSILLAISINYALSLTSFTAPDTIPLAMGSLGATAVGFPVLVASPEAHEIASQVLIYGLPESPLSSPRNVIGGHMLSALTGVIVRPTSSHASCAC